MEDVGLILLGLFGIAGWLLFAIAFCRARYFYRVHVNPDPMFTNGVLKVYESDTAPDGEPYQLILTETPEELAKKKKFIIRVEHV